MSNIDIDSCLAPLAGDSPTGEDLEYDQEFVNLELASQAAPDQVVRVKDPDNPSREIDRVTPGREPDYQTVMKLATQLFQRTKDLRVAMHMVPAATRMEGLAGLASGTELVAGLLETFWEGVHPMLSPDDDFDPVMRLNILGSFEDPDVVLRTVKAAPLVEARAIGRFTVRDLDVVNGEASPLEGQTAATKELLAVACGQSDPEELSARKEAAQRTKQALRRIVDVFQEKSTALPPEFPALIKYLDRIIALYGQAQAAADPGGDVASAVEGGEVVAGGGAMPAGGGSAPMAVSGRVGSRDDAKRLLEKACDYLEQTEPAHPAPLLVRRAIRLLDMNFLDIMKELTPDVVKEIEKLAGIKDEGGGGW